MQQIAHLKHKFIYFLFKPIIDFQYQNGIFAGWFFLVVYSLILFFNLRKKHSKGEIIGWYEKVMVGAGIIVFVFCTVAQIGMIIHGY